MKITKHILTFVFLSFLITTSAPSLQAHYLEKAQVKAWLSERSTTTKVGLAFAGIIGMGLFMSIFFGLANAVREIRKNGQHIAETKKTLIEQCKSQPNQLKADKINSIYTYVNKLCKDDPQINQKLKDGKTPLMFAAEWGSLELVQLLIAKGAAIKCACSEKVFTYDKGEWHEAIKHTCDAYDAEGYHAKDYVCCHKHPSIVDYFLNKK